MQIFKRFWNEPNLGDQVAAIAAAARAAGEAEGFDTGFYHALNGGCISEGAHDGKPREKEYEAELLKFEQVEFPILKTVADCNQYADPAGALRYYIEESDRLGAEAQQKGKQAAGGGEG